MNEYRKCGLYIRVSTERQVAEGESLDEQEERLREFCRVRNWKIVKVYYIEKKENPLKIQTGRHLRSF